MTNLCSCGTVKSPSGKCPNPECKGGTSSRAHKMAQVIVYSSKDEENWYAIKPAEVPEFCKDPDVMAQMLKGYAAKHPEHDEWFVAEKLK